MPDVTDQRRPRRPAGTPFDLPDQGDAPVVWDPAARKFVEQRPAAAKPAPVAAPGRAPSAKRTPAGQATSGGADGRRFFVGADAVGKAPPGAKGGGARPAAPAAPGRAAPAPVREKVAPRPLPRPKAPTRPAGAPPVAAPQTRRRRRVPRWLVIGVALLPLVLGLFGWLWATSTFSKVERVEVASVLDAADGGGTNYLIVGSDSRGSGDTAGIDGQRSDTLLVLRTEGDQSRIISIPRDLFVTNAATGEEGRINSAYNQGPANVIETIKNNLDIPIHRYVEVDFVTFASLVDALGGVTIDFPNTAIDRGSGLVVSETGPVVLNGEQSLAYVRSRNFTEIIDGREVVDPTGDLGRVNRQQVFLRTVMAKAGGSRNPFTLMRVASSVTDGLRIDDAMTLTDAVRFAWNMGRLNPESVVLPVSGRTTGGGAAVLDLVESEAPAALDQFR